MNAAYSQALTATGGTGPYGWTITSGTLPTGITINASTGALSGTPTVVGNYNFTVQALDANSCPGTKAYTLRVCPIISITPTSLANGTVGLAYTQATAFVASGGTGPYTYSASGVPAGLTFNTGTQKLTGTPTTAGLFNVVVTATDSTTCVGSITVPIRICPVLSITPATLANGTIGTAYSQATAFAASNGTAPYAFSTPTGIPAGMSWDSVNLKLIGTPTTPGANSVVLNVTDAVGCPGTLTVPLTIVCPTISVSPTTLASATAGSAYIQATAFTATGLTGTYNWTASSVPAGMTFDAVNKKLTGAPTTAGLFSVTITATDATYASCAGSVVVPFRVCPVITITPTTLANATVGAAYSQATAFAAANGTAPYTWTASGVPAGMTFDTATLKLIGTPTVAGTGNVTVTATDANGCPGSVVVPFTRVCPTITVTPTTLANAIIGQAYTQPTAFSAATTGNTSFTWTATSVPTGMTFDTVNKKLTGTQRLRACSTWSSPPPMRTPASAVSPCRSAFARTSRSRQARSPLAPSLALTRKPPPSQPAAAPRHTPSQLRAACLPAPRGMR